MDTYRPKRPTTLNLFPQVPRTQDTLNNNSFGEKDRRKEESKEIMTGEQSSDGGKVQRVGRPCNRHTGPTSYSSNRTKGDGVKPQKKIFASQNHKPDTASSRATAVVSISASTHTTVASKSSDNTAWKTESAMRETLKDLVQQQVQSCQASVAIVDEKMETAHSHKVKTGKETIHFTAHHGPIFKEQERYPHYFGGAELIFSDAVDEEDENVRLSPTQQRNASGNGRVSLSQSSDSNRMSLSSDSEAPPCSQHLHHSHSQPKPSISGEDEDEDGLLPPTPPRRTVSLTEAVGRETAWRTIAEVDEEEEEEVKMNRVAENFAVKGASTVAFKNTEVSGFTVTVKSQSGTTESKSSPALDPNVSSSDVSGLTYDSIKYTLVVDEHAKLELVSLKQCYKVYRDSDSDDNTIYESALEDEEEEEEDKREKQVQKRLKREQCSGLSVTTTTTTTDSGSDFPRSRKFRNVFGVGNVLQFSGAETFGLFSCIIAGEEREQSHRAVFRFVPRHDGELELEVDDPLLLEAQAEDLWCEAYNMRTGAHGIFPAFYAVTVAKDMMNTKAEKSDWVDTFWVKFLGSVQVPYHKGNDVLCAAMHKIATNRRLQMQFNPPSKCVVEINLRGMKIIVQDNCKSAERGDKCCNFFQLKNISFCGCHPKNKKYFGLITKHPAYQRFACHVFYSEESTAALAQSVGKAFQQYYKEHMSYSCPTEDIFLE